MLYISEIFHSIQGESSFAGLPCTFIRLSGCPLRCSYCDTSYSFAKGRAYTFEDILQIAFRAKIPYICITGGEPLSQSKVLGFMKILCDQGFMLSLETSGALSIQEVDPRVFVVIDFKVPSSGMLAKNDLKNLEYLREKDQVKFVIQDRHDYEWAKHFCLEHSLSKKVKELLFSPVYERLDPALLASWILEDQVPARLNLQIHKVIWPHESQMR